VCRTAKHKGQTRVLAYPVVTAPADQDSYSACEIGCKFVCVSSFCSEEGGCTEDCGPRSYCNCAPGISARVRIRVSEGYPHVGDVFVDGVSSGKVQNTGVVRLAPGRHTISIYWNRSRATRWTPTKRNEQCSVFSMEVEVTNSSEPMDIFVPFLDLC
jgi:hypothetical protein